jgi:cytochrome c oxidase subunit 1
MSSAGASILALGYMLPLVYFTWAMRYGKRASDNPWDARGLEWEIPSPPPTENFVVQPVVTERTYEYGREEAANVV